MPKSRFLCIILNWDALEYRPLYHTKPGRPSTQPYIISNQDPQNNVLYNMSNQVYNMSNQDAKEHCRLSSCQTRMPIAQEHCPL